MILWAVAGRKAIVGWRHIRVAYQPARKVRRSPGVLVTPTSSRSMQGIVVAVVVVHDRVVREARDETHGGTHNTRSRARSHTRTHSRTLAHARRSFSDAAAVGSRSPFNCCPELIFAC